ncbi:MAG: replicative DNA helicase [Alphaproteobacteria bacterium]|jgi:replicative DNA helicase|nr:replicative DNA helicase [Alphaproteobacteria bacterium]MBT5389672.1 replicative DNA helicase [Alphaproteobacteria bacterium]MBT5541034.1 replicative DNA helicase [Alphaproteobacteria bacterium]MBT5653969.1 replicative DNA helicase [Alphaproteobacteria bacterium]
MAQIAAQKTEATKQVVAVQPTPEVKDDYRLPPRNYEAEQALLGALLHNNGSFEKVSEFLIPDHFADPVHGRIYGAIGRLIERGQVADPITLKDHFNQDGELEEVGGWEYLVKLLESVISIVNVQDYGKLIHDLYLRRELITFGEEVILEAHEHNLEASANNLIEKSEQHLFDLATTGQLDRGFQPFSQALTDAIETAQIAYNSDSTVVGTTTGLKDLDSWLGGLHPSDLLILAGRPSMGKTALATNIAFNAAKAMLEKSSNGAKVAFFSLEMSAEQLATRLLSQEAEVTSDKIRRGEIRKDDFPKFVKVSRTLSSLPLFIDDTPALTVSALRTRARRLLRKEGLGLIVVDYLQLLNPPIGNGRRQDGRVQEISEITRCLKALAKELHVPILALSQLSRAVEQRDDKRPQLADLRESGSIEQDADVVMFIYREEYYESRKKPKEGTEKHLEWQQNMERIYNQADVIIAKQRHGPIGTIKLFNDSRFTKFSDLVTQNHLPTTK